MTLLDGGSVAEGQLGTSPSQSIRLSPNKLSSWAAISPRAPARSQRRNRKREGHLTRVTFLFQNWMEAASQAQLQ